MGQWTCRPDLVILVAGVGDVIGGGELSQVESSMGVVFLIEQSSMCAGLSRSSDTTFCCSLTIMVKVLSPRSMTL